MASHAREEAGKKGSKGDAKNEHPRTAMWISMAATGAFAVGAGVFALLAQDAKRDFENELNVFPNSKSDIDAARATLKTNAAITDVLWAPPRWPAGSRCIAPSSGGSKEERSGEEQRDAARVGFTPTFGGVAAVGSP